MDVCSDCGIGCDDVGLPSRLRVELDGLRACPSCSADGGMAPGRAVLWLLSRCPNATYETMPGTCGHRVDASLQHSRETGCWLLEVRCDEDVRMWAGCAGAGPTGTYHLRDPLGACEDGTNGRELELFVRPCADGDVPSGGYVRPWNWQRDPMCRQALYCLPCRTDAAFRRVLCELFPGTGAGDEVQCTKHGMTAESMEPGNYPPLVEQAVSMMRSMGRAALRVVLERRVSVSDAEYGRRMAVCEACPLFDDVPGRCRRCGCWRRFKLRLRTEHCPIDKW